MSIHVFDADAPQSVLAFLDETVSSRGPAHWRWKYRLGASTTPAAYYWQDPDGRIRGFIGMMQTHLEAYTQRIAAAWFVDWHVAPGERSVGIGVGLLRKAEAAAGVLLTLQGSADTRRILPSLGWKESTAPAVFLRPLTRRFVASRLAPRLPAALRGAAGALGAAAAQALACRRPTAPAGVELADVERIPAEYDRAWSVRAREFAPLMTRDSDYLNYMCADFPDGGYRIQLVRDAGEIAGHLVVRTDVDRDGLRRGRIVDLLWPRNRPELAAWLLRSACWQLQQEGADYVEAVVAVQDLQAALPRWFRRRRTLPIWYHRLPNEAPHPDDWYVTFLDCDRAYR